MTKEYKIMAVNRVKESGKSVASVAREQVVDIEHQWQLLRLLKLML